ncbi:hypothetical protein ACLKA6_017493 [Drosophila palustris]
MPTDWKHYKTCSQVAIQGSTYYYTKRRQGKWSRNATAAALENWILASTSGSTARSDQQKQEELRSPWGSSHQPCSTIKQARILDTHRKESSSGYSGLRSKS